MQLVQHFYVSILHSLQREVGCNFSGIGQVIGTKKAYKVFLTQILKTSATTGYVELVLKR